ncbi:MAG: type II toxin-antitoxin system VapC family toxin [Candidatus Verstraetearchaeota archaeon]|nr:type II toxin-antitoxin system VapC family toxin [Candidatus Verstraetearchaeota archaeon]
MLNMLVYLDTSAIIKRYVREPGSELVNEVYEKALSGNVTLSFSAWNIGEVLGALDKYRRRQWLSDEGYLKARVQFLGETLRFIKLRLIKIVPVSTGLLKQAWSLIEKYHIYQADALQLLSAKRVNSERFYTADASLHEIALKENLKSEYVG